MVKAPRNRVSLRPSGVSPLQLARQTNAGAPVPRVNRHQPRGLACACATHQPWDAVGTEQKRAEGIPECSALPRVTCGHCPTAIACYEHSYNTCRSHDDRNSRHRPGRNFALRRGPPGVEDRPCSEGKPIGTRCSLVGLGAAEHPPIISAYRVTRRRPPTGRRASRDVKSTAETAGPGYAERPQQDTASDLNV